MRFIIIFLLGLFRLSAAWDDDDFEVFDVVEDINQNFYEFLGVSQEATPAEVKSAFKKLTLKLHPDKNDSPDADVQFRNLVSINNILKDPVKREKYNEVLKNGLPNWRSAVYYYRHVRKMGLAEMSAILFIIISLGQYIVGWASYAEKRYTAEQILSTKFQKRQKKGNIVENEFQQFISQIPRPSVKNTLPFQIPKLIWYSIVSIPTSIIAAFNYYQEKQEEKIRELKRAEEERVRLEREAVEAEEARANRGLRKRKGFVPQERDDLPEQFGNNTNEDDTAPTVTKAAVITGGLWTDDDLAELVRLVKKYPGGTSDRWEKIAEAMCRAVPEVTHIAAKLKENCYKLPGQEIVELPQPEVPKKVKTRKADVSNLAESQANWTQAQQKALETALAKYPKSSAGDRWEKIAKCVPEKTKEDCMLRCKYLADLVKKQKQKEQESAEENLENVTTDEKCDDPDVISVERDR